MDLLNPLTQIIIRKSIKVDSADHRVSRLCDTQFVGDRERGGRVVARYHDGPDAGQVASPHRLSGFFPGWVFHPHQTQKCQT